MNSIKLSGKINIRKYFYLVLWIVLPAILITAILIFNLSRSASSSPELLSIVCRDLPAGRQQRSASGDLYAPALRRKIATGGGNEMGGFEKMRMFKEMLILKLIKEKRL